MSTETLPPGPASAPAVTSGPPRALASATTAPGVSPKPTREARWRKLCRDFLRCHRSPLNVTLHLVTTPLGLWGLLLAAAVVHPLGALAAVIGLAAWPAMWAPRLVTAINALLLAALAAVALAAHVTLGWGLAPAVAGLALGFLGQDAAHWLVGEPTYQSTYRDADRWTARWTEHTVLLLPVLLVLASRPRQSPLRLLVARRAVLKTKLTAPEQRADFAAFVNWVRQQQPTVTQSTHWWQSDLDGPARWAFDRLSRDPQLTAMIRRFHGRGYSVKPVLGMNEIYVTGPAKQRTSDTVFYSGHVDGPWAVFPAARLYRCMLALNENLEVTTHFPMSGTAYDRPESHRLEHGDAVAFDFNRELHYITRDPHAEQREPRINLKLHFVASPRRIPGYGRLLAWLTTTYDIRARQLFLNTIKPQSWRARLKTAWVLGGTAIFEWVVRHVGWTNLAWVAAMALVGAALRSPAWFVATTSFIHYGLYVGTLGARPRDSGVSRLSFGTFRRDALFFKSLALAQLMVLYATCWSGQLVSLALVTLGLALSTRAAQVLGLNRTLFSAELGYDSPVRIRRFPFAVIRHPMILGSMLAIAAMALVPPFRTSYGWLVAGHLLGYGAVLVHECVAARTRPVPADPADPAA
jgi:hypothetical protein